MLSSGRDKGSAILGFAASVVFLGLILHWVPVESSRVALRRLDAALGRVPQLKEEISALCGTLAPRKGFVSEKRFSDHFAAGLTGNVLKACTVNIESASLNRFHLHERWNYLVQIQPLAGGIPIERSIRVEFPRPLALLPIGILLLALIFEMRFWGFGLTAGFYLLALFGGSLTRLLEALSHLPLDLVRAEPNFQGLAVIAAWAACLLARKPPPTPAVGWEKAALQGLGLGVGLWSPIGFTTMGRVFFKVKGAASRLSPFLNAQLVLATVSLYLLNVSLDGGLSGLGKSLFASARLPRYFSFALLFFLGLSIVMRAQIAPWAAQPSVRLKSLGRGLIAVILVEAAAWFVPWLAQWPTLVRVGTVLLLSELVYPVGIEWKVAGRNAGLALLALTASFGIPLLSFEAGLIDVAMVLADFRQHPTALVLFTFLAGLLLGFLTGSFSAAFFSLVLGLSAHDVPQARAALLDGILAGMLLSPFCVFNLVAAAVFGLSPRRLLAFRWRQLGFPLAVGSVTYAVSTLASVSILQPVSFVFLCLVALTWHIRVRGWVWSLQ